MKYKFLLLLRAYIGICIQLKNSILGAEGLAVSCMIPHLFCYFFPKKLITDIIKGCVASFGICKPWEPSFPSLSSLFIVQRWQGTWWQDDGKKSVRAGSCHCRAVRVWCCVRHRTPSPCVSPPPFVCKCTGVWLWEVTGWQKLAAVDRSSDQWGGCRVTLLQSALEHLDGTAASSLSAWQSRVITGDTIAWQVREDFRADTAEKWSQLILNSGIDFFTLDNL